MPPWVKDWKERWGAERKLAGRFPLHCRPSQIKPTTDRLQHERGTAPGHSACRGFSKPGVALTSQIDSFCSLSLKLPFGGGWIDYRFDFRNTIGRKAALPGVFPDHLLV